MKLSRTSMAFLLGFACLAPISALAQTPPEHNIDLSRFDSLLQTGVTAEPANNLPATAGSLPASAATASSKLFNANAAATESAATVGTCDGYFTKSQFIGAALTPAFQAMAAKDVAKAATNLPLLEAQLDDLPKSELKAEVCNGNHINAYTDYQFFELSSLRARGIDNSLPADLPIIKQPDLNHPALAFVVAWIKYEQQDYKGALVALDKGLAAFPHDHVLQSEYRANLIQLQDGQRLIDFADDVIANTYDLDDATRSKVFVARAMGSLMLGRAADADQALSVALRYQYSDDVALLQTKLRNAMAGRK